MDKREKITQSLSTFKDCSREFIGTLGLCKSIIQNKNIDNILKIHLISVMPAIIKSDMFSLVSLKKFASLINMRAQFLENIPAFKTYYGYQMLELYRCSKQKCMISNNIILNKYHGIADRTVIHESIHGITQSYKLNFINGNYEYSNGFRKNIYNTDFKVLNVYGIALNEGFTEYATSRIMNNIERKNKKRKINGINQKFKAKQSVSYEKELIDKIKNCKLNPYGFKYDGFDVKYGIKNYTVYKKLAELLDLASNGEALKSFAKSDFDGFANQFDKLLGKGSFKNLVQTIDIFKTKIASNNYEYCNEEIKKLIADSINMIMNYFEENIEKSLDRNTDISYVITRMNNFKDMLPTNINKSGWRDIKNEILRNFTMKKKKKNSVKEKMEYFVVANVLYDDYVYGSKLIDENIQYQSVSGIEKRLGNLSESTMILKQNGKIRVFEIDNNEGYKSYAFDEILTNDLNQKGRMSKKEELIKQRLDAIYANKDQMQSHEEQSLPQYLVSRYYKNYIFVNAKDEVSVQKILPNGKDIKFEKLQLSEVKEFVEKKVDKTEHIGKTKDESLDIFSL